jgi:Zn-finger nucleic acid-binding protein
MSMIRKHAVASLGDAIWSRARASRIESAHTCPGCDRLMKTFDVEDASGTTELDGCLTCQFLWFDGAELARLGIVLKELPSGAVPRALADLEVHTLRENQKGKPRLAETLLDALLRGYYRYF